MKITKDTIQDLVRQELSNALKEASTLDMGDMTPEQKLLITVQQAIAMADGVDDSTKDALNRVLNDVLKS